MRYKIAGFLAVLFIYFGLIRPLRGYLVTNHIYPCAVAIAEEKKVKVQSNGSVSFAIYWPDKRYKVYKISGGIFLLLPLLALVFSKKRKKIFGALLLIHGVGILITLLLLFTGLKYHAFLLTAMPVISKYIVPAFSLSLVPLALSDKIFNNKS